MNAKPMPELVRKVLFCVLFSALAPNVALSLPGSAHDTMAELLLDTPAELGGAKGLTLDQIRAINDWIDNPATKTGEYMNQGVGKAVHPTNHGHLRHNPFRTAKALGGNGTVDPAKWNIARLHKIADIANNTAGVDGWQITPKMRQEAQRILDYVAKNKRLPKNLPTWVDKSGPLLTDRAKAIASSGSKTAAGGGAGEAAGLLSRFGPASKAGGFVTVGRIVIEGGIATIRYANGDLSRGQYEEELVAVGIKAVGSGVLTSAALICFTNPGTAVVFIVAVGACVVVDTIYGIVKDVFDDSDTWRAFYERLPREWRRALLVELVAPDPEMRNFGRTYGPVLSSTGGLSEERWQ